MAKSYTLDKGFRVDRGWADALRGLSPEEFQKVFWLLYDYQMSGGKSPGQYEGTDILSHIVVSLIVPQIDNRLEGAVGGKSRGKNSAAKTGETPSPAKETPASEGGTAGGTEGGTERKTEQNKTVQDSTDDDRTESGGSSSPQSRSEAEKEDAEETVRLYGELCPSLAPPPALSGDLRRKLRQAQQCFSPDQMRQLFIRAQATPFLRGEGPKGWRASLPWLLQNGKRVLSGEFDSFMPPAPPPAANSSFDTDSFFEAALQRSYGSTV